MNSRAALLATSSIEHDLLLACLRVRLGGESSSTPSELAVRGVDWLGFVRTALRHGVAPLVYTPLERLGSTGAPPDILEALRLHREASRLHSDRLIAAVIEILETCTQRGVAAIAISGAMLSRMGPGGVPRSLAPDPDVLVHRKAVPLAREALAELGYVEAREWMTGRRSDSSARALPARRDWRDRFIRPTDSQAAEVHWALAPRRDAVRLDTRALWQRACSTTVSGETFTSLCVEDLLLILCVRGTRHGWRRLDEVVRIAALVHCEPRIRWSSLLDGARRRGCERMVLVGMLLAHRWLGAPLAPEVEQCSSAHPAARSLATELAEKAALDGRAPAIPAEARRFRIRVRERARDKLEVMVRGLIDRGLEPVVDPVGIARDKLVAREAWSKRADAWCRWAEGRREQSEELAAPLLDAVQLSRGQRVLDLASGPGVATCSIARRIGDQGEVVAVDVVLPMLSAVNQHATASALESIEPCAADMEDLPFADGSFHRLVCGFGILFSSRFERALSESFRVLESEGRAAFSVWGPIEGNTFFDVMFRSLETAGWDLLPRSPLFRFAARARLAQAMSRAGFTRVAERDVHLEEPMPDAPRFWLPQLETIFGELLSGMSGNERGRFEEAVEAGFTARRGVEENRLYTHYRVVVGTRS